MATFSCQSITATQVDNFGKTIFGKMHSFIVISLLSLFPSAAANLAGGCNYLRKGLRQYVEKSTFAAYAYARLGQRCELFASAHPRFFMREVVVAQQLWSLGDRVKALSSVDALDAVQYDVTDAIISTARLEGKAFDLLKLDSLPECPTCVECPVPPPSPPTPEPREPCPPLPPTPEPSEPCPTLPPTPEQPLPTSEPCEPCSTSTPCPPLSTPEPCEPCPPLPPTPEPSEPCPTLPPTSEQPLPTSEPCEPCSPSPTPEPCEPPPAATITIVIGDNDTKVVTTGGETCA